MLTILLLALAFPGVLFDNTFEAHYHDIVGRFGLKRKEPLPGTRTPWLKLGVLAGVVGILSGLLDPDFGFDRASAALYVGFLLFFATLVFAELAQVRFFNRRWPDTSWVNAMPVALFVGIATVGLSRLVDFQPGYLYGAVAGATTLAVTTKRHDAAAAAVTLGSVLVAAVVAWFLLIPVGDAAAGKHPAFLLLVLDAFLGAMFVGGIEAVLLQMMPLQYFDGRAIWDYNRWVWVAITVPTGLLFVHALISQGGRSHSGSAIFVTALFCGFGAFSVGFWSYWRSRDRRAERKTTEPVRV